MPPPAARVAHGSVLEKREEAARGEQAPAATAVARPAPVHLQPPSARLLQEAAREEEEEEEEEESELMPLCLLNQ